MQVFLARVTRAACPSWLLVAIHYTEQTGGRIDVVRDGLRFVLAAADGEWTVKLPVSADRLAEALDRDGLHRMLGIGQSEYMTALIESTR